MNLAIITPQRVSAVANVQRVSVPGSLGSFVILQGHAPLASTMAQGVVRYSCSGEERELAVSGGVVRVERDEVSIIIEQ